MNKAKLKWTAAAGCRWNGLATPGLCYQHRQPTPDPARVLKGAHPRRKLVADGDLKSKKASHVERECLETEGREVIRHTSLRFGNLRSHNGAAIRRTSQLRVRRADRCRTPGRGKGKGAR